MKIITKKQTRKAIMQIAANYIIAEDALKKADLPFEHFSDSVNHLADNSISLAYIVGGEDGIRTLNEIINKYQTIKNSK